MLKTTHIPGDFTGFEADYRDGGIGGVGNANEHGEYKPDPILYDSKGDPVAWKVRRRVGYGGQ